ncbi:SubName: Full=Uncharacterized protein {ECO:0000313/EMBL:CCA73583.1} [Serendipita indica DSM 11827]|uniref:Uncharacterized protein n=1 Tax=Serendipita indica (strain DSM 11827) TaxID=1109443 RepID=G4TQJ0_SERID|nr:SubName: Full=Uncharacterized protein {ECO:0000313/EMBL:CCA73583.1} [Serendipita indica DSM 11827]CCA73583.1 hypothetical protein PIIN_07535 [Serendipita indica DSM 11827]
MAQSLSAECTPLKLKYDACFNVWLEEYLSPQLGISSPSPKTGTSSSSLPKGANANASEDAKALRTKRMAQAYEDKCGPAWKAYNACITKAVKEHKLEELITQAREENPLRELESHLDRTHSP